MKAGVYFWAFIFMIASAAHSFNVNVRLLSVSGRRTATALRSAKHEAVAATPSPFRFHNLTDTERIFCISDLHTDHAANLEWLASSELHNHHLCETDLLIVAGDISHHLNSTFRTSLRFLRSRCRILFVPGNHEAWLTPDDRVSSIHDSLTKLQACYDMCREEDIYVDPVWVGRKGGNAAWILPLESWYDGSLSFDESLCRGFEYWPWVDFAKCTWPPAFPTADNVQNNKVHTNLARIPLGLVEHFLQRNEDSILQPWKSYIQQHHAEIDSNTTLITVSHFLPNQQCLPDWKNLSATIFSTDEWLDHGAGTTSAKFAKVAGSRLLGAQLERYTPDIHIFGHSHRPKDFVLANTRYIHHPLGKPRERSWHMIAPNVTYLPVWDQRRGIVPPPQPVIRYWEESGGGVQALRERLAEQRQQRSLRSAKRRR